MGPEKWWVPHPKKVVEKQHVEKPNVARCAPHCYVLLLSKAVKLNRSFSEDITLFLKHLEKMVTFQT